MKPPKYTYGQTVQIFATGEIKEIAKVCSNHLFQKVSYIMTDGKQYSSDQICDAPDDTVTKKDELISDIKDLTRKQLARMCELNPEWGIDTSELRTRTALAEEVSKHINTI